MNKKDFEALKDRARVTKEKSTDMDTMIAAIMKLPYGQLKKVLTNEVMEILEKYGYGED